MCSSYFILILFCNTILNDFDPDTDLGTALIRSIGPDKETWGLNGSKTRKRLRNSVFWRAGLWLIRKGLVHALYLPGYLELIQKTLAESEEVHHRDKLLSLAFTEQRTIWTLNKSLFAESLWLLGFCLSSFWERVMLWDLVVPDRIPWMTLDKYKWNWERVLANSFSGIHKSKLICSASYGDRNEDVRRATIWYFCLSV